MIDFSLFWPGRFVYIPTKLDQGDAMELEPEMLCEELREAAEEVPWKKVLRAAGRLYSEFGTKPTEGFMGSFRGEFGPAHVHFELEAAILAPQQA